MTLTLYLVGPVRLLCSARGEITPRSLKARGALALLGSADGMRMGRAQLQDKLWSKSSPEQGSTSLRQMLRELRTALGPSREALLAGPGWVGLDGAQVSVNLSTAYGPGAGGRAEFAADLDIDDPEFEDWLRDMRASHETRMEQVDAPAPVAAGLPPNQQLAGLTRAGGLMRLLISPPSAIDDRARLSASILIQEACWRAAELLPAELVNQAEARQGSDASETHSVAVNSVATVQGAQVTILITMSHADTGKVIAMRQFTWPIDDEFDHMPRAIWTLASIVMSASKSLATMRNTTTLWDLFQFDRKKLVETDRHLVELQEEQPTRAATVMALRAFMRWTMVIERLAPDPIEMAEEADALASEARGFAPGNATVLGVSALLMTEAGKKSVAKEFALLAESADPHESFGRLAMVQSLLDHGQGEAAYANINGMRNSLLASVAPASWYMQRARTEVRLGLFEQAEISSATAHSFAPKNRAALRFMGVLRQARGDEEGGQNSFDQLGKLEPGFTPQLLSDPSYPVATLRLAGLIK